MLSCFLVQVYALLESTIAPQILMGSQLLTFNEMLLYLLTNYEPRKALGDQKAKNIEQIHRKHLGLCLGL